MSNIKHTQMIQMSGHYKLEVRGEDGQLKQTMEGDNVITDQFLINCAKDSSITTPEIYWDYGYLSTSTTTPNQATSTLTGVVAAVGRTGPVYTTVGSGTDWWTYCTITYTFAKNAYLGTFSAVGCGQNSNGSGLSSWLRLIDGGGSPTSLTLVTNDQITLTYVIKCKRPKAIITGSITLNSVNYGYSIWPCNITLANQTWESHPARWLQYTTRWANCYSSMSAIDITSLPTGTLISAVDSSNTRYSGQPYMEKVHFYSVSNGNGNIKAVTIAGYTSGPGGSGNITGAQLMCTFDTVIPKTNLQELTLTFRMTYGRV